MRSSERILCKVPLKTIADRRARRQVPTVPPGEGEFTEPEQEVFKRLERRTRPAALP